MLPPTFFHLIAIFQFSDISIYMTKEGFTPNFINFGRSAAELRPFEVALSRVSEPFAINKSSQKQARNGDSRFFSQRLLSCWATKIAEILNIILIHNLVWHIRYLRNRNQMERKYFLYFWIFVLSYVVPCCTSSAPHCTPYDAIKLKEMALHTFFA